MKCPSYQIRCVGVAGVLVGGGSPSVSVDGRHQGDRTGGRRSGWCIRGTLYRVRVYLHRGSRGALQRPPTFQTVSGTPFRERRRMEVRSGVPPKDLLGILLRST